MFCIGYRFLHFTIATNAHNIVQLAGPKLVKADGAEVDSSYLAKKDYILVYFSAHWCQPCRAFTPVLVKFYNDYADQGNFEVVFVSADQSQRDMFNYMTSEKMPWVAEPFSKRYGPLTDKYGARVIPNLVLIQPDGKVLSASFANGQSAGPSHVLVDLQQRLAQQKAQKATAAAKP